MSKDSCSYHQTRPALWACGDCSRYFCNQCVIVTERDAALPRCALCSKELDYLGGGNAARPFWAVAHRFFAFPFSGSGIAFMLSMGLLSLLVPLGLLGVLVFLFMVAAGVKYGFAVLEAVAMGQTRAPSVSDAISGDEDHLFAKFILMLMTVGFMQLVLDVLVSPVLGTLFGVLVTLVMPAMVILLAVNRKFGEAMSPGPIATLIGAIGWPYVLAVFLTNVISTGPFLVVAAFQASLADSLLALPLLAVLVSYFAVVNFAMLGHLLYEHQGSLGYVAGNPEDDRLPAAPENLRKQLLGRANVLVKEGRAADALAMLHGRAGEFVDDMLFQQRHVELARQSGDAAALARACDPCLELLMARDGAEQALDLWRSARTVDPTYRPANPAIRHTLAERARDRNLKPEALALLVNLHKSAPDYGELDGAYRLAGELLRELGQKDKADQLERFLPAFLAKRAQSASGNLSLS